MRHLIKLTLFLEAFVFIIYWLLWIVIYLTSGDKMQLIVLPITLVAVFACIILAMLMGYVANKIGLEH